MLFAAGDEVRLAVTATDDVAAAGGKVSVNGSTLDHVYLAGGDISLLNTTARDVFAAGGEIDLLSGQVLDDVVAAGGRVDLGPDANVAGDVVVSGGELRIESAVGGGLRAAGGRIYLDATVNGDVHLQGNQITLGPDARILGALTHRGRSVQIDPGAQITGQVTALRPHPRPDFSPLAPLALWMSVSILFGLFLMAVIIAAAFPRLMNEAAASLRAQPLLMLALGVGLMILTPFAIVLLAITVIGLPLAFVVGAAFALLWPVAIVATAYAMGMFARARLRKETSAPSTGARVLWAGVAMIALIALGLIPLLGSVLWFLAWLFGMGAVVLRGGQALARAPAAA
jgi:cytoskeletal protein CcmA (bactofilin family)